MPIGYKAALCAAALLCAGEAQAATLVQTFTSSDGGAVLAAKFNENAGPLTSVTISTTFAQTVYLGYFSAGTPTVEVTGTYGDRGIGIADVSGFYNSTRSLGPEIAIQIAGTLSRIETSDFSDFTGTGVLVLQAVLNRPTFTANGEQLFQVGGPGKGFSSRQYTVTYNYDETLAVPEPSTWALMLAGFGLVGYSLRRRAKVAFA